MKDENIKFVATDSFKDENGKPLGWVLRHVSSEKISELLKECSKTCVDVTVLDSRKYIEKVVVNSIVEPDLNDVELQESYEVNTEEDLLNEMLNAGEYYRLKRKILDINLKWIIKDIEDEETVENIKRILKDEEIMGGINGL